MTLDTSFAVPRTSIELKNIFRMTLKDEQHSMWLKSMRVTRWSRGFREVMLPGHLDCLFLKVSKSFGLRNVPDVPQRNSKKSFDKVCFKTGNQKHPNFRFDEKVETLSSFLFKKYFQSTKGLNFDQIFDKGSTNPVSSPSSEAQNEQGRLCRCVG